MNQMAEILENPVPEGTVYEGLRVTQQPAPFIKRFFAYSVDIGIISAVLYGVFIVLLLAGALSIPFFKALADSIHSPKAVAAGGLFILIIVLLGILVAYHAYFILFESRQGLTPGKRVFGLQVVSLNGNRLTLGQCVLRDMFRYIDCGLVIPGVASILMTKRSQRLGDLAANTLVTYSAHKEQAANYLYVKQDDYLLLKEQWSPSPVPIKVCEEYLGFAYPVFFQGKGTSDQTQIDAWRQLALQYVHPQNQQSVDSTTILLFFAEVCFQTIQFKQRSHR